MLLKKWIAFNHRYYGQINGELEYEYAFNLISLSLFFALDSAIETSFFN